MLALCIDSSSQGRLVLGVLDLDCIDGLLCEYGLTCGSLHSEIWVGLGIYHACMHALIAVWPSSGLPDLDGSWSGGHT